MLHLIAVRHIYTSNSTMSTHHITTTKSEYFVLNQLAMVFNTTVADIIRRCSLSRGMLQIDPQTAKKAYAEPSFSHESEEELPAPNPATLGMFPGWK